MNHSEISKDQLRAINHDTLQKASKDIQRQLESILASPKSPDAIEQLNSAQFELYSSEGEAYRCYLNLLPIDIHNGVPSVEIQLHFLQGQYDDPGGFYNLKRPLTENGKSIEDPSIARYDTNLHIDFSVFKSVGVGTCMLSEGEKILELLWRKGNVPTSIKKLRLVIEDGSTPAKWSARRAKELGYDRFGKNVNDLPQFKKEIPLSAQPSGGFLSTLRRRIF